MSPSNSISIKYNNIYIYYKISKTLFYAPKTTIRKTFYKIKGKTLYRLPSYNFPHSPLH